MWPRGRFTGSIALSPEGMAVGKDHRLMYFEMHRTGSGYSGYAGDPGVAVPSPWMAWGRHQALSSILSDGLDSGGTGSARASWLAARLA